MKFEITNNQTGNIETVGADSIPLLFPNQDSGQVIELLAKGAIMFPETALPVLRSPINFGGLFSKIFN